MLSTACHSIFKMLLSVCDLSSRGAHVPEEESQLFQVGWWIPAHVRA